MLRGFKLEDRIKVLEEKVSELLHRIDKLEGKKKKSEANPNSAKVKECFLYCYKKRYGFDYMGWGAKENTQILNWMKSYSFEQCIYLIEYYFRWNDPFIVREGHPLSLLIMKSQRLVTDIKARHNKMLAEKEYKNENKKVEGELDVYEYARSRSEETSEKNVGEIQDSSRKSLPRL